jgi:hypothetical protein
MRWFATVNSPFDSPILIDYHEVITCYHKISPQVVSKWSTCLISIGFRAAVFTYWFNLINSSDRLIDSNRFIWSYQYVYLYCGFLISVVHLINSFGPSDLLFIRPIISIGLIAFETVHLVQSIIVLSNHSIGLVDVPHLLTGDAISMSVRYTIRAIE